jgi:signal transduction histidine kinase
MIAFHRSGAVRVAALFLVLFLCAMVAAFAATYWIVRAEMLSRMRADLVSYADAIAAHLPAQPPAAALFDPSGRRIAALFEPDGSLVVGKAGLSAFTGWRQIPATDIGFTEAGDETSDLVLEYGRRAGDRILVVGQGMRDLEDAEEVLLDGFVWSLAIVVLVGIVGATVIAWRVDRRLGRTEEALTAYASGEMSRRLPLSGSGDELDRTAVAVNAVLDRLAAMIETTRQVTTDAAHDLKTPMTRLRYRLAEAEGASPGEVKAVLGAAARDAEQIVATFDALLRIAQIEAGARRARFDRVDLSDVLETVADAYGPDAEQAGQHLETVIAPRLFVTGDRDLLIQAFANLLENAIRHAGKGAAVAVEAMGRNSTVEAVVSDTGPGVPAADRERVLRRFVRLEASRSTPGTGLGLTLVKAIADLHKAQIALGDNAPGLRVTITFARPETG